MTRTLTVTTVDPTTERARYDAARYPSSPDLFEVETSFGYVTLFMATSGRFCIRICNEKGHNVAGGDNAYYDAEYLASAWAEKLWVLPNYSREELVEAIKLLQTVAELL